MGRLIDEDILIKRIYEYQTNAIDTEDAIHSIKTMPTAYDVEAVVAELIFNYRAMGFDIETERMTTKNRYGNAVTVAVYRLKGTPESKVVTA